MLHVGPGVPDNLTSAAALLAVNFQIICFHRRGTKLSPGNNRDYSIKSYLTDIDRIAAYFDIQHFHLFGHSWGGLYAQIYTECHPKKVLSLFLCSPGSGTGWQWKQTEQEVLQFNKSKSNFIEYLNMGINSLLGMFGSDKAYQRLFTQVIKNYNKGFAITNNLSFDLQNIKADPINLTRKQLLKYPVLKNNANTNLKITITYGDNDIYGDSKRFIKERFLSATYFTLTDCGHLAWLHNFNDFKRILTDHFKA